MTDTSGPAPAQENALQKFGDWVSNEFHIVEGWVETTVQEGEAFVTKETEIAWGDVKTVFGMIKPQLYADLRAEIAKAWNVLSGVTDFAQLETTFLNLLSSEAPHLLADAQALGSEGLQLLFALFRTANPA